MVCRYSRLLHGWYGGMVVHAFPGQEPSDSPLLHLLPPPYSPFPRPGLHGNAVRPCAEVLAHECGLLLAWRVPEDRSADDGILIVTRLPRCSLRPSRVLALHPAAVLSFVSVSSAHAQAFAKAYYEDNKSLTTDVDAGDVKPEGFDPRSFRPSSPDVIVVLTFSLIMLHTDAHNPSVKKERKMTLQQFITNNR
jgi:hypothetical protein